jgi:hypothetical protein
MTIKIENKVKDISVSNFSKDCEINLLLRRSYIPFGGIIAISNCQCGAKTKKRLFYLHVHHFEIENCLIKCKCGKEIFFSYEKMVDPN